MGSILLTLLLVFQIGAAQTSEVTAKFNRAVERQRQGDWAGAAAEYQAILALQPNYAEAQANYGVVLARLGRFAEAVTAYEAALRLAPQLTPILLNLGIVHYRAGQFSKAVENLEKFLAIKSDSLQARQLRGIALVELGREAEAVTELEQTLALAPNDPAVLYSLGLAYLRLGRPGMKAALERLASFPAGRPAAHLLHGQVLLARQEYERAIEELQTAASLSQELPRLHYSLGLAYLKLGRNKEAIAAFDAELVRLPEDFSTLYYLAYLHEAEDNLELARQRLDAAIKLTPQSTEAQTLLSKILTRQGKPAEALGPLELAVAKDPTDPVKRYMLARLYRQLGRNEEATREFAEVQRLKAEQLKQDRARTPQP